MIDFIYGCDYLVGVSVYISLINFGHKIYLMIKLWYNKRMRIIDGFQLRDPCIIRQYIHSKTAENHLLFSKYCFTISIDTMIVSNASVFVIVFDTSGS